MDGRKTRNHQEMTRGTPSRSHWLQIKCAMMEKNAAADIGAGTQAQERNSNVTSSHMRSRHRNAFQSYQASSSSFRAGSLGQYCAPQFGWAFQPAHFFFPFSYIPTAVPLQSLPSRKTDEAKCGKLLTDQLESYLTQTFHLVPGTSLCGLFTSLLCCHTWCQFNRVQVFVVPKCLPKSPYMNSSIYDSLGTLKGMYANNH